jgi:hypothetical protein
MRKLIAVAALVLTACATGPSEKGWRSNPGAQSFDTSSSACSQISRGNTNDFNICMAGRGWSRVKK